MRKEPLLTRSQVSGKCKGVLPQLNKLTARKSGKQTEAETTLRWNSCCIREKQRRGRLFRGWENQPTAGRSASGALIDSAETRTRHRTRRPGCSPVHLARKSRVRGQGDRRLSRKRKQNPRRVLRRPQLCFTPADTLPHGNKTQLHRQ